MIMTKPPFHYPHCGHIQQKNRKLCRSCGNRLKPVEDYDRASVAADQIVKDFSGLTIDDPEQQLMTGQLVQRLTRELNAFFMKDWMASDADFTKL
jgi:hypothetical protein